MNPRHVLIDVLFITEWIAVMAILILLINTEGGTFRTTLIISSVVLLVLVTIAEIYLYRYRWLTENGHVIIVRGRRWRWLHRRKTH